MSRAMATRIGDGKPAIVLEDFQRVWPGLEVFFRRDDISRPTDWRIHQARHSVVVHLGGQMQRLETELEGFGGSCGPALPGEVWTAPAERRYSSHALGGAIQYAVLVLEPNAADSMQGTNTGRLDMVPRAGVRDPFLHQAVKQLRAVASETSDVSQMLSESLSQTIGLHLLRTYSPDRATVPAKPPAGPPMGERKARCLREFIHDHLDECLRLDDLAALAGMTTHRLLLAFRQAFGTTPAQYIIQQRLRRAQWQLLHTGKDITTIALECGFASHSHLTACFSRHLGCCPQAWRADRGSRGKRST